MKPEPAHLVLEDGSVYRGYAFGATDGSAHGEVVFNTSMTGYQEMLTDPSYAGQIVMATYPLVGNYGVNPKDFESRKVQVSGFVVREHCLEPSHALRTMTLHEFLASQGVPGIFGVDTRAVTRRLRTHGVMMGIIAVGETPETALARLHDLPVYGDVDFVSKVTTWEPYRWDAGVESLEEPPSTAVRTSQLPAIVAAPAIETSETPQPAVPYGKKVLVSDYGLKYNILRILHSMGCQVTVFPATATVEELLAHEPDGMVLSPGPGDPDLLDYAVLTAKGLVGKVPILGICLGNQVVAKAFGAKTFKLKFGHRGGNHPVRDERTGRVHITAQNHGYAVDPDSLPPELEVSHVSVNDGTVEGLRHTSLPVMSIQYHSEASPGPRDNEYIFDQFLSMVTGAGK